MTAALIAFGAGCAAVPPTSQVGTEDTPESAAPALNSSAAPTVSPTAEIASTSLVPEGPKINWDAPLGEAKGTSPSAVAKDGALTFTPRTPQFSIAPVTVQVSHPDQAVAYVYRFPLGVDFPTDGRIRVLEYATSSTETDLEGVVKNAPGPPEDFAVLTVAGHRALLVQADGVGRIQYIHNGVMYDITGPAAPTAVVKKLAAQL